MTAGETREAPTRRGAPSSGASGALDVLLFRRGPRWLLPCTIAGLIAAVMPEMHYSVFGVERITQATIDQVRSELGVRVDDRAREKMERAREIMERAARERSVPLLATANFAFALAAIFMAGAALNVALLLLGAELSAGQALTVAAAASCGTAILHAVTWGAVVWLLPDSPVSPDWGHVGKADASMFVQSTVPAVLRTAAASIDVVRLVGVALAAIGVRMYDDRIGVGTAIAASAVWLMTGLMFRVLVAAIMGVAIV